MTEREQGIPVEAGRELESGRKLDALIAEKVMNLGVSGVHPIVPFYSLSMGEAWMVVEWLRKRGLYLQMNDTQAQYRARFFDAESTVHWDRQSADGAYYSFAATAPHAICLAALRAVEHLSGNPVVGEPVR